VDLAKVNPSTEIKYRIYQHERGGIEIQGFGALWPVGLQMNFTDQFRVVQSATFLQF